MHAIIAYACMDCQRALLARFKVPPVESTPRRRIRMKSIDEEHLTRSVRDNRCTSVSLFSIKY